MDSTFIAAIFCRVSGSPVGPLSSERLEQLPRARNGFKIRVVETEYESLGVDTPEDWQGRRAIRKNDVTK